MRTRYVLFVGLFSLATTICAQGEPAGAAAIVGI